MKRKNVITSQWKNIALSGLRKIQAGWLMPIAAIAILVNVPSDGLTQPLTVLSGRLDTIFVSDTKTTAMLLPATITMFDIGSEDFGGVKDDNLLRLKAADTSVMPTTLIIKYGDEIFHGTIAYSAVPPELFIDFKEYLPTSEKVPEVALAPQVDSAAIKSLQLIQDRLSSVLSDPKEYYKEIAVEVPHERIALTLSDLRVDSAHVYMKLLLINRSRLDYHIDFVEFIYQDPLSQKNLRGAYDRKNVYAASSNSVSLVTPKDKRQLGFAIPRFAASRKADLLVVVHEKQGSRLINLPIPFKIILESKTIQ